VKPLEWTAAIQRPEQVLNAVTATAAAAGIATSVWTGGTAAGISATAATAATAAAAGAAAATTIAAMAARAARTISATLTPARIAAIAAVHAAALIHTAAAARGSQRNGRHRGSQKSILGHLSSPRIAVRPEPLAKQDQCGYLKALSAARIGGIEKIVRIDPRAATGSVQRQLSSPVVNRALHFPGVMPAPLPISALNHVAVVTRRLAASKKFYSEVLGFQEVARPNFKFEGAWLYGHGLMIHLLAYDAAGGAMNVQPGGEIRTRDYHLALHSDDLAAVERILQQHGIAFRRNQQADTGVQQLFFQDPDGFHIEVGTYPPLPPVNK
jgi:catechol 2,3-dioxygenase-like lactoylglutathione lyase family enzyme